MTDLQQKLNSSIDKGITFLLRNQFENGQFRCYMSNNDEMLTYEGSPAGWLVEEGLVFPSILIGNSLMFLTEYADVEEILNKITHFLLSQRKEGSVWNHYTPAHAAYLLCPFDLDDTACASAFLKARNVNFPSNVNLLIKNINSKKLFYTWFTFGTQFNFNMKYWRLVLRELKRPVRSFIFWQKMPCERNDIDAVVNANVLYYLPEAPNAQYVINYLLNIIKNNQEGHCDKWYENVFVVYYFISRNYNENITSLKPARQIIIDRIKEKITKNGYAGKSVLDIALAICALFNFHLFDNELIMPLIEFIISKQNIDGNWERRGLYVDGYAEAKTVCWGSEELTTGLCLEALARYKELQSI